MNSEAKGDPIPTRFEPEEEKVIDDIRKKTGLSKSEIVRRAVRWVRLEFEEKGNANFLFDLVPAEKRKRK